MLLLPRNSSALLAILWLVDVVRLVSASVEMGIAGRGSKIAPRVFIISMVWTPSCLGQSLCFIINYLTSCLTLFFLVYTGGRHLVREDADERLG